MKQMGIFSICTDSLLIFQHKDEPWQSCSWPLPQFISHLSFPLLFMSQLYSTSLSLINTKLDLPPGLLMCCGLFQASPIPPLLPGQAPILPLFLLQEGSPKPRPNLALLLFAPQHPVLVLYFTHHTFTYNPLTVYLSVFLECKLQKAGN